MLSLLPENAILTPHPKEFERLAGTASDSWSRLQQQIGLKKYGVIVLF
jgi:NAD(P)H-hydrate epimerase